MGRVSAELGARVYLDTNIVIYAIEGFAGLADQIRALLQALDDAEIVAVTSELTLAEALIKPLKNQNQLAQQAYKKFLTPTSALQVVPISNDILEAAAQLRAATKLKMPDAIHLATANLSGCDCFLTNDDSNPSLPPISKSFLKSILFELSAAKRGRPISRHARARTERLTDSCTDSATSRPTDEIETQNSGS